MGYRKLQSSEIDQLISQGCTSSGWNLIEVDSEFDASHVLNVSFSGDIRIGKLSGSFVQPGGVYQNSALRNARLHNCSIGNGVFIDGVNNYIANYDIGDHTYIQNVDMIYVQGISSFGNGQKVAVMNEQGGREIPIYDHLNAHFAYILTFYRHRPKLLVQLLKIIENYCSTISSDRGFIGNNVTILNAGAIKNVKIGDNTTLEGTKLLDEGSINSNATAPVHIGYSVVANNFIISSGVRITDGVMLNRCFIGQACRLGHTYSATDSLFFSNCQGENGEASSIFAGPYTVTHHKSTLLIAGMFSFMNAGSGSNQSNHMYKLGAIHQGIVERGGKTTSNSYILWPARIGAYSLIMGRHTSNADTSNLPFSYLIEKDNTTILVPAVNLKSVGTIRDAKKFPKRDLRADPDKLDFINFNLLSPYTIEKMFKGIEVLEDLKNTCGETSSIYAYQGCSITSKALQRAISLYNLAIKKFLGNSLLSRLSNCSYNNDAEIRSCLVPDTNIGLGDWRDLSGLIAPQSAITELISLIEREQLKTTQSIHGYFRTLHESYYTYEWTWAWSKIELYYNVSLDTITASDVKRITQEWLKAVIALDEMVYEDAKKEFSLSSRISFGLDGNRYTQKIDFECVRGVFVENDFVKTVLEHIEVKTRLGDDLISRLKLD